jgi:hypothetical protein
MWALGPRRWSEPVVRRLIDESVGRPPGLLVERFTDRLRAERDQLPIDTAAIASRLGIRRSVRPLPFAGRIWVDERGETSMDVNAGDLPARQRFTEAHALLHTAFPGFAQERRYRLDASTERNPPNRQEEYLCDLGAGALLMPRDLIRGLFDPRDGFEAVQRLAEAAHVSLEAAANRLVAVSEEPVVLLCMSHMHAPWERRLIRQGDSPFERLRVRYAAAHNVPVSVPRFASPDPGSELAEAAMYHGGQVTDRLPGVNLPLFDINVWVYEDRTYAFAWPAALLP